MMYVAKIVNK